MPHALSSSIAGLVAVVALAPSGVAQNHDQRTRTVYVCVTDKNGAAVTDMEAAEFEVKEGGKAREIVHAGAATTPLRIALLVADQGTGAFQLGLARFMQKLLGHAEFSLTSVVVQPEKLLDYSHEGRELSAALSRLGSRGRETGAQLMEAIEEALKDIQHEDRRPVIVVMRLGGEAATSITGNDVREQLRKSGAALYVVSAAGAQGTAPPQARGTDAVSVQQGQLRDAELAEGAFNLAQVLGDGSRESGGRHDQVIATSHAKALEQLADELLNQYEVTYRGDAGVKPNEKLTVTSRRKGVAVRAPSRIPM